jgi:hypothetical protein
MYVQDIYGDLRSPLTDTNLDFDFVRQQYFDTPALTHEQHQKFESVNIPLLEELEFLVDNTSSVFYIPTGGLSTTQSEVSFDWDVYLNYEYYGRYCGWSGYRSSGIKINTRTPRRHIASYVDLSIGYERFDRKKDTKRIIGVMSDGDYEYLPFYIIMMDNGIYLEHRMGVYEDIAFDVYRDRMEVTYAVPFLEVDNRIVQFVAVYPYGKEIEAEDVRYYALDLVRKDMLNDPVEVCSLFTDTTVECRVPAFLAKWAAGKIVKRCQLPDIKVQGGYSECPAEYLTPNQSRITIRPRYNIELAQGWLRAFGFTEERSSYETWNEAENKDKVLRVRCAISPKMVCVSDTATGDYCMRNWFNACRNMTIGNRFYYTFDWNRVKRAGKEWCYQKFFACESITSFPPDYNEPQNIETCGDDFNAFKYEECVHLVRINDRYSEPNSLREFGHRFTAGEFSGCVRLQGVSAVYCEPLRVSAQKPLHDINAYKFANCRSLVDLRNYGETPLTFAGNNYHLCKFLNCTGLERLSVHYTEADIETAGHNYSRDKFKGCEELKTLGRLYKIADVKTTGNNALLGTFSFCPKLVYNPLMRLPNIDSNKEGVFEHTFYLPFSNRPPMRQNVSAAKIINGNILSSTRGTFTNNEAFDDYEQLDSKWTSQ